MALLVAKDIGKAWGDRPVLRSCDLRVEEGDRIGLVGRNGSGKSTLLAILGGQLPYDHGSLQVSGTVALLAQNPDLHGETVDDAVGEALAWHTDLLRRYEAALAAGDLDEATRLQDTLDLRGWEQDHRVDAMLEQLGAPARTARTRLPSGNPSGSARFPASLASLSGGERRRVALAVSLLRQPDVLLLDEPTNHLDADTVEWLQGYLAGYRGGLVLVTHDRYLLEAVAERIVEVEDGVTVHYGGSYGDYLVERAERQARLVEQRGRQLRLIASEAAWAARSPSARSTKQRARLQRLEALQESLPQLSSRDYAFDFRSGVPRGTTLLQARELTKSLGGRTLFEGVHLDLQPGDRLGILGPNGAGKTTLLRVLLGALEPDRGEVLLGPRARVGLLDQARTGLVDDDTVFEAAGGGNEQVRIGEIWIHVASFLGRFAFERSTFDQKVGALSGGERARLLLARLMLQGANVLVLDEPTNDLDLLTLRVLEDALLAFDGVAIVVTHDRAFLDRVCNAVLAFEGDGEVVRYASRQQHLEALARKRKARVSQAPPPPPKPAAPKTRTGLSYKEKQELEGLPDRIEALEAELARLEAVLADPATYRDRADEVGDLTRRLEALPAEIEALYDRWEALGG